MPLRTTRATFALTSISAGCCTSAAACSEAEAVYRDAIAKSKADGTLLFNLGVLLEDLDRPRDAAHAYRAALDAAPDLADAHFNLARLCEAQGLRREAVRHWSAFRKLTGKK